MCIRSGSWPRLVPGETRCLKVEKGGVSSWRGPRPCSARTKGSTDVEPRAVEDTRSVFRVVQCTT